MPQALAFKAWLAVASTFGTTAGIIAYYATYAATVVALSKAAEALAKQTGKRQNPGLEVAVTDAAADGRVIYGRVKTSGVNVIPPLTSGSSGQKLHQVLALASHEVSDFGNVYFDDDVILDVNIGAVSGGASDGAVSGASKYAGYAWIRRYAGTTSQNVDFILNDAFPSSFTSTFRGRGIAYIATEMDWGGGEVYESGPPNITVIVEGKECYDPRLDASPGADPTNPAFAAFTSCPALHWADYKTNDVYGQQVPATDIDWDSVVEAADVCDELVAVPTASTQARYTFNGVLSTGTDTRDNERMIIDAMLGKMAFSGGKWRIFAGAWRAPEAHHSIEAEDWVEINGIRTVAGRNESRYNGVVTYYIDSSRKWQQVESYRRINDTYKSADGAERIWLEIDQPHCTNEYEAQRKGEFVLRQSRNGISVTGSLPPRFSTLRTWDNVTVTFDDFGWDAKTFTVASCVPRPDGAVDVTLIEEQEADWDDLLEAAYGAPSTSTIPATNPTSPTEPSSFAITELLGTLQFDIGVPSIRPKETRYQIIRSVGTLAAPGSSSVSTTIWEGAVTKVVLPADVRTYYWYHARAFINSYYSPLSPSTHGIGARPWIGPEAMPGNRGYPDGEMFFASGSYWTWANRPNQCSYSLITSDGLTVQRGKMIVSVVSNHTFTDGAGVAGQSRIHPLRFDANSRISFIGVPVFPGQSGTFMVLARPQGSTATPVMTVRVAPLRVNSPKAIDFGGHLVSTALNTTVPASGQWAVTIGSFTMPTSTVYDAVTLYVRLNDTVTQSIGIVELGGAQLSTL